MGKLHHVGGQIGGIEMVPWQGSLVPLLGAEAP